MVIVRPADPLQLLTELPRKLAARLGYHQDDPPDEIVSKAISESIAMVGEKFEPRGLYRIIEVKSVDANGINLEHGAIQSPLLARLARRCGGKKSLALSIATAGEEWRKGLGAGRASWMDLLIDALGSELAELAADLVEDGYRAEARSRGLKVSARMSPGYCDWGLEGQELIFKALEAREIGVSLTPHCIMVPAKTVSGAAVLAQNIAFDAPCALCSKDCPHRRIPRIR
jgi:hypothetical protein